METNSFKTCIDCANRQSNQNLPKDTYYCPYVQSILPNGIVYYDTDATDCVRNGIFRDINPNLK